MIQSFGKVSVATPGTPVKAATNTPTPGPYTTCNAVLIEAWPGNVGNIYIGMMQTMSRSTGAGVVGILGAPTANFLPSWSATIAYAPGGIDVAELWIDADNGGDAVLVSSAAT